MSICKSWKNPDSISLNRGHWIDPFVCMHFDKWTVWRTDKKVYMNVYLDYIYVKVIGQRSRSLCEKISYGLLVVDTTVAVHRPVPIVWC